jgi:predicted membrane protein
MYIYRNPPLIILTLLYLRWDSSDNPWEILVSLLCLSAYLFPLLHLANSEDSFIIVTAPNIIQMSIKKHLSTVFWVGLHLWILCEKLSYIFYLIHNTFNQDCPTHFNDSPDHTLINFRHKYYNTVHYTLRHNFVIITLHWRVPMLLKVCVYKPV